MPDKLTRTDRRLGRENFAHLERNCKNCKKKVIGGHRSGRLRALTVKARIVSAEPVVRVKDDQRLLVEFPASG